MIVSALTKTQAAEVLRIKAIADADQKAHAVAVLLSRTFNVHARHTIRCLFQDINCYSRTSALANVPAILADHNLSDVDDVIDAVEASKNDPYGSTLAAMYGTPELFKHADKVDWANYTGDVAGYAVSTYDELRAEIENLKSLSVMADPVNIFGEAVTPELRRAEVAVSLRSMAERLQSIAAHMDLPPVDQRNTPLIGFDAAQSVDK